MTGRSIPEWVGSSPDAKIPDKVKARICLRQEGRCAIHPGERLRVGHFDFDHTLALCLGGAHSETNLRAICKDAHKVKTAEDVGRRAKADRVRIKHLGLKPKSKGFRGHRKFNGELVWKDAK